MKNIFQKSLAVGALAATGLIATASGAFAQAAPADATVNFTGTVGSVCIFSNPVDGTLADIGGSLAANEVDGTRGSVDLDCTGDADVTVSEPIDNGSTNDLLAGTGFYESRVLVGNGPADTRNGSGGPSGPLLLTGAGAGVSETLNVDLFIDPTLPIPEGAYNYNVIVTATPL
ncbi:MAG: hypothetical protein ABG776_05540 [Cyanobacteria bacterium J06555_13]